MSRRHPSGRLCQRDLLRRGWSREDIDRVIGEPDHTSPNPHHADAAPIRWYRRDRVEVAEVDRRTAALDASSDDRRWVSAVRRMPILVAEVALESLLPICRRGVEHFHAFTLDTLTEAEADVLAAYLVMHAVTADDALLSRITVLRHEAALRAWRVRLARALSPQYPAVAPAFARAVERPLDGTLSRAS
ncbi:MAG: hypothetical protein ACYC5V_10540 [Gemmatimonadaceae bacterium]